MTQVDSKKKSYHHGNLRAALLEAGEKVLAEKGVEEFTLRGVARAAGVSHAAPAHHFKSVTHFLTEMTIIAFERLRDNLQSAREQVKDRDPQAFIRSAGKGYFQFAMCNPQHFRLMFRTNIVDHSDGRVRKIANEAFSELMILAGRIHKVEDVMSDPLAKTDVLLLWSIVHGYSHLVLENQIGGEVAGKDGLSCDEQLMAIMSRLLLAIVPK